MNVRELTSALKVFAPGTFRIVDKDTLQTIIKFVIANQPKVLAVWTKNEDSDVFLGTVTGDVSDVRAYFRRHDNDRYLAITAIEPFQVPEGFKKRQSDLREQQKELKSQICAIDKKLKEG